MSVTRTPQQAHSKSSGAAAVRSRNVQLRCQWRERGGSRRRHTQRTQCKRARDARSHAHKLLQCHCLDYGARSRSPKCGNRPLLNLRLSGRHPGFQQPNSTAQPQPLVQPERQPRKLRLRRRRHSEQPYSAAIGPQLHPQHQHVNNKEGHKNEVK